VGATDDEGYYRYPKGAGSLDADRPLPDRFDVPVLPHASSAFSLIELLVTLTLIAAIAGIGLPAIADAMDDARVAHAASEIAALSAEVSVFFYDNERYPDSLAEIGQAGVLDPYGNPYYYTNIAGSGNKGGVAMGRRDRFLVPVNSDFDLYSAGKDGITSLPFTASESQDDVVRANNGMFVGLAKDF